MINPRALALQGIGFRPSAVATQGFLAGLPAPSAAVSYADANARSYAKRRTPYGREYADADEMRRQVALMRQIEHEDEVVLALVMAAVPLIGETKWRH